MRLAMGKFADGNCTVDGESGPSWHMKGFFTSGGSSSQHGCLNTKSWSSMTWIWGYSHGLETPIRVRYEFLLSAQPAVAGCFQITLQNATSQRPHQIRWFVWGIVPKMPLNLASHLLPTGNLDYQISIFGSFNQLIPKFNLIPMCLISPSTFDAFDQGQVTDWAMGDRNSLFLGEIRGVDRPRTCQTPQGHLSLMISWYVELYS